MEVSPTARVVPRPLIPFLEKMTQTALDGSNMRVIVPFCAESPYVGTGMEKSPHSFRARWLRPAPRRSILRRERIIGKADPRLRTISREVTAGIYSCSIQTSNQTRVSKRPEGESPLANVDQGNGHAASVYDRGDWLGRNVLVSFCRAVYNF